MLRDNTFHLIILVKHFTDCQKQASLLLKPTSKTIKESTNVYKNTLWNSFNKKQALCVIKFIRFNFK